MSIGPYVPGWLLRLSGPAVGVGCALLTDASSGLVLIAGGLAMLTLIWPASVAPTALALLLGLLSFVWPDQPYDPRALALLAGIHLTLQLCALAGRSTWRRRTELSALGPPLRRYLLLQAIAQSLALLAGLLGAEQLTVRWLPVAGGLALAGSVVWLLGRLRRHAGRP